MVVLGVALLAAAPSRMNDEAAALVNGAGTCTCCDFPKCSTLTGCTGGTFVRVGEAKKQDCDCKAESGASPCSAESASKADCTRTNGTGNVCGVGIC